MPKRLANEASDGVVVLAEDEVDVDCDDEAALVVVDVLEPEEAEALDETAATASSIIFMDG